VPGRKFTLSDQRLLNRTIPTRIAIALAAPAFAIAAVAVGGGFSATASAQPVSQVRLASQARSDSFRVLRVTNSPAAKPKPKKHPKPTRHHPKKHHPVKHHKRHPHRTAKQIAWHIMNWFGWKARFQFRYLNDLWARESSWNKYASNPYSGAYGIPQAMPGSKMATCGGDWRTNAKTQIRWGMRYIKAIYGSPKAAWAHEVDDGWY
jgi:hypothetical protein